jgi:hypothetical protein
VYLRAETLGEKVAGRVLDYAGDDYGPHIDGELLARRNAYGDTKIAGMYAELQQARHTARPAALAASLREVDKLAGSRSGLRPSSDRLPGLRVRGLRDQAGGPGGRARQG